MMRRCFSKEDSAFLFRDNKCASFSQYASRDLTRYLFKYLEMDRLSAYVERQRIQLHFIYAHLFIKNMDAGLAVK